MRTTEISCISKNEEEICESRREGKHFQLMEMLVGFYNMN